MHPTDSDGPGRSGRGPAGAAAVNGRFDGESARRILQRAAAEQQRLSNEMAESYSFEELEEIAAEAGISPEALRAAVEAHRSRSGGRAAGTPPVDDERPGTLSAAVTRPMPRHWSRAVKTGVLATAGGLGFVGLLLAFPAVAETVFWALLLLLVLVTVLILLGAAPF
ncbi:MAG TPA: hypothetical protein VHG33_08940 [Woeseiaceae bacterium]|nr:hypothetical protein [Woeseiaceae bacterium]